MPNFKLTSSKTVLTTPIFDVAHERAVGPGGVVIERRIVKHPGAAVMVARNERGEILLIRQFRLPIRRQLWELPAGTIDPAETPLRAAKRELAEETGVPGTPVAQVACVLSDAGVLQRKDDGVPGGRLNVG